MVREEGELKRIRLTAEWSNFDGQMTGVRHAKAQRP